MTLITDKNHAILDHAVMFETKEPYASSMCGERLGKSQRPRDDTVTEALDKLRALRPSPVARTDERFIRDFYESHSYGVCCLPKEHSGACYRYLSGQRALPENVANKVADCYQAPGQDKYVYKNRTARTFPIQLSYEVSRGLRETYRLPQRDRKLRAAVPLKQAGTGFTVATALFDYYALLTAQQGEPLRGRVPEDVYRGFEAHCERLIAYWAEQSVRIVSADGLLCDPLTLTPVELAHWSLEDDTRSDPRQIQIGHMMPVAEDKYSTRGGNVLPLCRKTNMMQGPGSLGDLFEFMRRVLALHEGMNDGGDS